MNLLTDPLLRVQTDKGLQHMSLPTLMAALGRDEVNHLVGIQCHQEGAFHVFICYLGGAILARCGDNDPVQSEAYWREGMRMLAGKAGDDAWKLVVNDLSKPAFMQPPLPKSDHERLKLLADLPDAMDLLATAKNHDVKKERAMHPEVDEWFYALLSLQTMSGFFGRDNPGISRMNSGFGNRLIVELIRNNRPGSRWRDAVVRLFQHRQVVLSGAYGYDPQGLVLVWLELWDGQYSIPLSSLDPFYIEICRRVRLRGNGTISHADVVPSPSNRIDAKELKGVVGDAWLPIDQTSKDKLDRAYTISARGLTADVMQRLVFSEDLIMTAMQKPLNSWQGQMSLTASVLVRGQGTTDGYYERTVSIPPAVQPRIFGPVEQRDPFASLSRQAIEYAGTMLYKVLRPAIFCYLEGAPETLQFRDSAKAWWVRYARRFEALWSDEYFNWLWSVPNNFDQLPVLKEWVLCLRDYALAVLREAQEAMPGHVGRYYRTRIQSERLFWGAYYKKDNFPFMKEEDA